MDSLYSNVTALLVATPITSSPLLVEKYSSLTLLAFADQNFTVKVEYSADGRNYDHNIVKPVLAAVLTDGESEVFPVLAKWIRVTLFNLTAIAQTTLRFHLYGVHSPVPALDPVESNFPNSLGYGGTAIPIGIGTTYETKWIDCSGYTNVQFFGNADGDYHVIARWSMDHGVTIDLSEIGSNVLSGVPFSANYPVLTRWLSFSFVNDDVGAINFRYQVALNTNKSTG